MTEAFTESEQHVMPEPTSPAEALGWVVQLDLIDNTTLTGVVRGSTYSRLEVQWDGECGRKCCLDSVKIEDVDFISLEPCDCGSGQPAMLCLCDDPIVD